MSLQAGGDRVAARGAEALAMQTRGDRDAAQVLAARARRDYASCEVFAEAARRDYHAAKVLLHTAQAQNSGEDGGTDLFDVDCNSNISDAVGTALGARKRARAELAAAHASPSAQTDEASPTAALVRRAKSTAEVAKTVALEDGAKVERLMARQLRLRQYDLAAGTAADAVAAVAQAQLSDVNMFGSTTLGFAKAAEVGYRIPVAKAASNGDAELERVARACVPFVTKDLSGLRLALDAAWAFYIQAGDARGAEVALRCGNGLEAVCAADDAWAEVTERLGTGEYGPAARALRRTRCALRAAMAGLPCLNVSLDTVAAVLVAVTRTATGMISALALEDAQRRLEAAMTILATLVGGGRNAKDRADFLATQTSPIELARAEAAAARATLEWVVSADDEKCARAAAGAEAAEAERCLVVSRANVAAASAAAALHAKWPRSITTCPGNTAVDLLGLDLSLFALHESGTPLLAVEADASSQVACAVADAINEERDPTARFRERLASGAAPDISDVLARLAGEGAEQRAQLLLRRFMKLFKVPRVALYRGDANSTPVPDGVMCGVETARQRRKKACEALAAVGKVETNFEVIAGEKAADALLCDARVLGDKGDDQGRLEKLAAAEASLAAHGFNSRASETRRKRLRGLAAAAELNVEAFVRQGSLDSALEQADAAFFYRRQADDTVGAARVERTRAPIVADQRIAEADSALTRHEYHDAVEALAAAAEQLHTLDTSNAKEPANAHKTFVNGGYVGVTSASLPSVTSKCEESSATLGRGQCLTPVEYVCQRADADGRATKREALEAVIYGDLEKALELAVEAQSCFDWSDDAHREERDTKALVKGTKLSQLIPPQTQLQPSQVINTHTTFSHAVGDVLISVRYAREERAGAAALKNADAALLVDDRVVAVSALEKAATRFHCAQHAHQELLGLATDLLCVPGAAHDALLLQNYVARLRAETQYEGGRGAARVAALSGALTVDAALDNDMPRLLSSARESNCYDDVRLRLAAARNAYETQRCAVPNALNKKLKTRAKALDATVSTKTSDDDDDVAAPRLQKLLRYETLVDALASHADAERSRDYEKSVAHLKTAQLELRALQSTPPKSLRAPPADLVSTAPAVAHVVLAAVAAANSARQAAESSFERFDFDQAFILLDQADSSFAWAAQQESVLSTLDGIVDKATAEACAACATVVTAAKQAPVVPDILEIAQPSSSLTYVAHLRDVATQAKALAMGQARQATAEQARFSGEYDMALSLLAGVYELLRLAGSDSEELAERASNRAAGVRGDAALLAARQAYSNGALELATRLLVESPNGALGLYTEALEPEKVEETSALLARLDADQTFDAYEPSLKKHDFDAALDVLTRAVSRYEAFQRPATQRIQLLDNSIDWEEALPPSKVPSELTPWDRVALAARKEGDRLKAESVHALNKLKDSPAATLALESARKCFTWAKADQGKCGLDLIAQDIVLFDLRSDAERELEAAFAASKSHATQTALVAVQNARIKYVEAACQKEAQDLGKLHACLQGDAKLENVKGFLCSGPTADGTTVLIALGAAKAAYQEVTVLRASGLRVWIARASGHLEQITRVHTFVAHWLEFNNVSRRIEAIAATKLSEDVTSPAGRRVSLKQQRSKRGTKSPPAAIQLAKILEQAAASLNEIQQIAQKLPWGLCIAIDTLDACLADCETRYAKCFPTFPLDRTNSRRFVSSDIQCDSFESKIQ